MLKWICLLLLVINIGFFGWTLDQRTRETASARSNALTIDADVPRLKLIDELDQAPVRRLETPATTPTPAAAETGAGEPELEASLPGISATLPESLIVPMRLAADACFSFGPFAESQRAEHLLGWLQARDSRATLRRESVTDDAATRGKQLSWVYLEPRDDAEATLRELRASGVSDVRLIETGDLENAISLGLFSSQASVNRRLRELQDRGYRPVVVPYSEDSAVSWVDARISRSGTIDELIRDFPAGLNYLPVQCDKIALPEANP